MTLLTKAGIEHIEFKIKKKSIGIISCTKPPEYYYISCLIPLLLLLLLRLLLRLLLLIPSPDSFYPFFPFCFFFRGILHRHSPSSHYLLSLATFSSNFHHPPPHQCTV